MCIEEPLEVEVTIYNELSAHYERDEDGHFKMHFYTESD